MLKKIIGIILSVSMMLSIICVQTYVNADTPVVIEKDYVTAFSNTYIDNCVPNLAYDNNDSTYFQGEYQPNAAEKVPWCYVDLGAEFPIKQLDFLPGPSGTYDNNKGKYARFINVYLTNEKPTQAVPADGVQIFTGVNEVPQGADKYDSAKVINSDDIESAVSAASKTNSFRYILFSKNASMDNAGMALREVKAYTDSDSYENAEKKSRCENIAALKPGYITWCMDEETRNPRVFNDGYAGAAKYQLYTNGVNPLQYIIDLNDEYHIKYLNICPGVDALGYMHVYLTNDSSFRYENMTDVTGTFTLKGYYQSSLFELDDPNEYRYVVVERKNTDNPSDSAFELAEIEVYTEIENLKENEFDDQSLMEISRNMKVYDNTYVNPKSVTQAGDTLNSSLINDGKYGTPFAYTNGAETILPYVYFDLGKAQKIHSASFFSAWFSDKTTGYYSMVNDPIKLVATNDNSLDISEWDVISEYKDEIKRNDTKLKVMSVEKDKLDNKYRYVGFLCTRGAYSVLAFNEIAIWSNANEVESVISPVEATLSGDKKTVSVNVKTAIPGNDVIYHAYVATYKIDSKTGVRRLTGTAFQNASKLTGGKVNGSLIKGWSAVSPDAIDIDIDVSYLDIENADEIKFMLLDSSSTIRPIAIEIL